MQQAATTSVSHPNRQTLLALYDAFADGDMETAMAMLTDDVEWRVNGPAPVAGTYHGKDEVLSFMPRMMAQYDWTLRVETTSILADERHGVVRVAERAERPGGGVAYTGVHLWDFRDGKCACFESHYDDAYTDFWSARSAFTQHGTN